MLKTADKIQFSRIKLLFISRNPKTALQRCLYFCATKPNMKFSSRQMGLRYDIGKDI
jgi:hypothetical protein